MSEHRATIDWRLETAEFNYESYNRSHSLAFDHGVHAPGTKIGSKSIPCGMQDPVPVDRHPPSVQTAPSPV